MNTRHIRYWEEVKGRSDREHTVPLHTFLLSLPYLGVCGIFPHRQALNSFLKSGKAGGGMSPGARWEPFEVTESEYAAALPHILNPEPDKSGEQPFWTWALDHEFDGLTDYREWAKAASNKHLESFGLRMAALQHLMVMRGKA